MNTQIKQTTHKLSFTVHRPPFTTYLTLLLFLPIFLQAQNSARQYLDQGNEFLKQKDYDGGRLAYRAAIKAYTAKEDSDSVMVAYHEVIYSFFDQRNFDAVFPEVDQALAICRDRKITPSFFTAKTYALRAYVYGRMAKRNEALLDYESAIKIYEQLGSNHENVAYAYKGAAMILMRRQDYPKTIHYLKSALKSDSTGVYQASIYSQLANCNLYIPNIEETLKYYHLGVAALDGELRQKRSLALLHTYASEAYTTKKDFKKAEEFSQKALAFFQTNERFWFYRIGRYITLGKLMKYQKDKAKALHYFEKALEEKTANTNEKDRMFANLYSAIGTLHQEEGDHLLALDYFQKGFQQIFPNFNATDPIRCPDFEEVYPEPWIMTIAAKKGESLFALYQEQKDIRYLSAAADSYELALKAEAEQKNTYDSESAKLYLGTYAHPYFEKAIDVYYEWFQKTKEEAFIHRIFALMEQSKASVLEEAIQQNNAIVYSTIPDSLLQIEKDWRVRMADKKKHISLERLNEAQMDSLRLEQLESELATEQKGYAVYLGTLKKNYPKFESTLERVTEPAFVDLQSQLKKEKAVLLEYFVGEQSIYLLSLEGQSQQLFKIERTTKLDKQINQFLHYFEDANAINQAPAAYLKMAHQLFAQLFPEGWRTDNRNQQLILIPDGRLKFLPFEALTQEKVNSLSTDRYVLHDFTTQYAYSAALFLFENKRIRSPRKLLKIAPGFLQKERGLLPLTHSEEETRSLKNNIALIGENANVENFQAYAANSKVIHLSTHASASTEQENARIELIDKAIYLPEIYAMNLSADLVVLSACESGMGKIEKGEGVMSLGRAFRYAGASSIVASLWNVNEASTARLFSNFYEQLNLGQGRASALRQAKLTYLNTVESDLKKSPYYWSGFVYFGKDKPLDLSTSSNWLMWCLVLGVVLFGLWFGRKKTIRN